MLVGPKTNLLSHSNLLYIPDRRQGVHPLGWVERIVDIRRADSHGQRTH